jgi:hypothetical protein
MQQPEPVSLDTAYKILTARTGRSWTRTEFFTAVIERSLPLVGTTPADTRPVIRGFGHEYHARLEGPRPYAALLTSNIRDLSAHGQTVTDAVALSPWHEGYMTWEQIKNRRKQMNRAAHTPATWEEQWPDCPWSEGEIMGEHATAVFSPPVLVTDATCRVPAATIEELVVAADEELVPQGPMAEPADTNSEFVSADSLPLELEAVNGESANAGEKAAESSVTTTANGSAQVAAVPVVNAVRHRVRRDALHVAFDKAIARAGNFETADVRLQLKELALASEPPFTGQVQGDAFMYTNEENAVVPLTRDAFYARLKRMRSKKTGD